MKISILGAGNVATNLALAFKKAGHELVQIYNRSDDTGKALAIAAASSFTSDINDLAGADIYILAVKDDAIEERATQLKVGNRIVVHTSGTKSKNLLQESSTEFGIFYPLQTMRKNSKLDFRNVPILVEGSSAKTTEMLKDLAQSISHNVHMVDETQRQWIHLAAVFANNFTNHLFTISENILGAHNLSLDILKPLIFSFINNLETQSPSEIQTGPAVRGDKNTIDQHLLLLAGDARLQKVYQIMTDSIIASASLKEL